jgi:ribosomal-protein-alanine N-acetyltransferase
VAARVPDAVTGPLEVHLAPMRRRHLRSVLRIESQVYPRPWSLSLFMSELALRSSRCYTVARVDGLVVGYAGFLVNGEDAHITNIAVDPAWQRCGIGTRLLAHVVRSAVERGAHHLTLEVRVSNSAAQSLYRNFGFHPAGVRRNYYVETNEDALVMWANDISGHVYQERLAHLEAAIPGETVVWPSRAVDGSFEGDGESQP